MRLIATSVDFDVHDVLRTPLTLRFLVGLDLDSVPLPPGLGAFIEQHAPSCDGHNSSGATAASDRRKYPPLTSLRNLEVKIGDAASEASLAALLDICPSLDDLRVIAEQGINTALASVSAQCSKVTYLSLRLSENAPLVAAGVSAQLSALPLKTSTLTCPEWFSVRTVARHLGRSLRGLHLKGCHCPGISELEDVLTNPGPTLHSGIRNLTLKGDSLVNDMSIALLPRVVPALTSLCLEEVSSLTTATPLQQLPLLRTLSIEWKHTPRLAYDADAAAVFSRSLRVCRNITSLSLVMVPLTDDLVEELCREVPGLVSIKALGDAVCCSTFLAMSPRTRRVFAAARSISKGVGP